MVTGVGLGVMSRPPLYLQQAVRVDGVRAVADFYLGIGTGEAEAISSATPAALDMLTSLGLSLCANFKSWRLRHTSFAISLREEPGYA